MALSADLNDLYQQIRQQQMQAMGLQGGALSQYAATPPAAKKPDPPVIAEPRTAPFIGYRYWRLGTVEHPLIPLSDNRINPWDCPVVVADRCPTEWNTNGIYAWFASNLDLKGDAGPYVGGRLRLYGTVLEHEKGVRASHAVIEMLALEPPSDPAIIVAMERMYQCPITQVVCTQELHAALKAGL